MGIKNVRISFYTASNRIKTKESTLSSFHMNMDPIKFQNWNQTLNLCSQNRIKTKESTLSSFHMNMDPIKFQNWNQTRNLCSLCLILRSSKFKFSKSWVAQFWLSGTSTIWLTHCVLSPRVCWLLFLHSTLCD